MKKEKRDSGRKETWKRYHVRTDDNKIAMRVIIFPMESTIDISTVEKYSSLSQRVLILF